MPPFVARYCLALLLSTTAIATPTWQKVVAPEFTVYSSGSAKETLRTAEDLQQFIAALQSILPVDPRALPPLTVVLFGRDREFRDYRPKQPNGKPANVAGFFSRREGWAVFGLSTATLDDEVRETVYHEAVHWFTSGYDLPNPPWLEEGIAEVFSTFQVKDGKVTWGEAIDYHVTVLSQQKPLSMVRLLNISPSDPLFNESQRTGQFYASSWAFVHYLLFGQNGMSRAVLSNYLKLSHLAAHPDDTFKQAFGGDYQTMDRQLAQYLKGGKYFKPQIPAKAAAEPLRVEPASDLEREIALARLAIGAGQNERALVHAHRARELGPDSAAASETLGYAAESAKDNATLLTAFTEAARQGSKDFRVHFVLGQLAHTASANGTFGGLSLDPAAARQVASHYQRAINLKPTYLPAYQNLGGVVELSDKAGPHDREFLAFGEKLYPGDRMIQLGLAVLDRKLGAPAEARQRLQAVLNALPAPPLHVVAYARRLDESWTYQDIRAQIETLMNQQEFTAAIAVIDQAVANGLPPGPRYEFLGQKRALNAYVLLKAATTARNNSKMDEARSLLEEVIASDASASAKNTARSQLAELQRFQPRAK